mmetsp:Transcript_41375/g.74404  ORF Transcript_41375/g.74404 Transcript_41375/m.74404 type:complete len:302 (-) Transcript_41375:953-1858(-)
MNFLSSMLSGKDSGSGGVVGGGTSGGGALNSSGRHSGGDSRDDGRVRFGYSLLQGKRGNMEDYHAAGFKRDPRSGQVVGFFGVFDGHGGPAAADYVRSNVFLNLLQHKAFGADLHTAISESFVDTDNGYLKQAESGGGGGDDGCTAVTAVLLGQRLVVANVGDSRAVLCKGGRAYALSVDHKPNRLDERRRIEQAGGVVVWAGTWRVGGVLAVSRAFGDRMLKQYVVAVPDIQEESLAGDAEFLILASDGLWDVLPNQESVALIKDIKDPEKAAVKLTEEAFARGSNDNITCVVLRFNFGA